MDIANRIKETEQKFEDIKESINKIKQELQKHGATTINDLEVELVKLQGEFRLLSDMNETPDAKKGDK